MKVQKGDVVFGPDFIGSGSRRPYIVISNGQHPFSGEECLVVLVTTTERKAAVPLDEESFRSGKLPRKSYASPWTVTTLKTDVIERRAGELTEQTMETLQEELEKYIF